eukprot:2109700-Amphidinium_carterae.1
MTVKRLFGFLFPFAGVDSCSDTYVIMIWLLGHFRQMAAAWSPSGRHHTLGGRCLKVTFGTCGANG